MSFLSRTDRSLLGTWFWTVDRTMLSLVGVLMIYGIVLVAAASPSVALRIGLSENYFLIHHIVILFIAFPFMIFMSFLSPKGLWRIASFILVLGLFAMALLPFIGMEIKGAHRWIHVFGFSFQPSEFVKPAFAIVVARLISLQKEKENIPGELYAVGLFGLVVLLLMMQPDFGMTFVVTCIFGVQIFLAGCRFKYLMLVGVISVFALFVVYNSFDHVQHRIDGFLNPASGNTYQVDKSLESFREGVFIGVGPGQGTVKLTLPDAHADFIFAVSGEELGFLFTFLLAGVYLSIVMHGFRKIEESEDMFSILACGGILTMIGLQALIHMGSSLHLLPAKGMTLPFISYGGTSLLSIGFAIGAVLSLTRHKKQTRIVRKKSYH